MPTNEMTMLSARERQREGERATEPHSVPSKVGHVVDVTRTCVHRVAVASRTVPLGFLVTRCELLHREHVAALT